MSTQKGRQAESIVKSYLENKGYVILAQNIVILGGEVDLLAKKDNALIIIEVKSTRRKPVIHPLYAITPQKIHRLLKTTHHYCNAKNIDYDSLQLDILIVQNNLIAEHHENVTVN